MPLSEVCIDRRLTRYWSRQILDGARLRGHHTPIRFADVDLFDIQFFVGGAVGEDELAEILDPGVALDFNADALFAQSGPVFLEPVGRLHLLENICLLRIIRLFLLGGLRFFRGLLRLSRRSLGRTLGLGCAEVTYSI
jgi:hypothetical protein